MIKTRQTQIIKIGNSNGVRIPKEYLSAFGTKEVVSEFINNTVTIKPVKDIAPPRSKWNEILAKMEITPEEDLNDFDTTLADGIDDL